MKKITLSICLFLIIILSMSFVSAEFVVSNEVSNNDLVESNIEVVYLVTNTDFAATVSSQNINICQCDSSSSYLTITNVGTLASRYSISIDEDYVSLSQNTVTLLPGESARVNIFYQASCSALFSDNVKIKITSINGVTGEIDQKINFINCQNLAVAFEDKEIELNPCETETFKLRIKNLGNFNEVYKISIEEPMNKYVTLNYNQVSIEKNSFADIDLFFAPTCDMYGELPINAVVEAVNNGKISLITKNTTINQNYIFNTTLEENELFVCEGEEYETTLFLENYNNFENEFNFKIDAPKFVQFKFPEIENKGMASSLILSKESQTSIPIIINASKEKEGDYEIKIETTSKFGDVTKNITIPVHVQNCYDLSIDANTKKLKMCGKDSLNHTITITNKGVKETPFSLNYIGPNFAEFNESVLTIGPQTSLDVDLIMDDVRDINEKYPLTIELYRQGNLVDSTKFSTDITTAQDCYKIILKDAYVGILETEDSFEVQVQNKGLRYGKYLVELTSTPDYLSLDDDVLTLGSTAKDELTFNINRTELRNNAQQYNNNSIIGITAKPTIIFTHIDSNTRYYQSFLFEVRDYPFYQKAFEYIYSLSTCLLIFLTLVLATLICGIILLVKGLRKNKVRMNFSFTKILAIVFLVLIIIAGVFVFNNNEIPFNLPLKSDSQLNLHMYENTQKTVDIEPYFIDEDENIILYGAIFDTNNSNFTYIFNNSNLTLLPKLNWFGNETFSVSATDDYLETAKSEPITINVKKVKTYNSFEELFSAYCPFLNWIMLILFLLSLVLCLSYRKMTKKELQKEERDKKREEKRIEREKQKALKEKQNKKTTKIKKTKTK